MSELRFDGRVAVITGAGGGLGRSYAELLASRGADVVRNDVEGGDGVDDTGDVGDPAEAEALVQRALDTHGRLDIVIANAGITGQGALAPPDVWERVVATHLYGTVNVLRAALPHLLDQDYGRVVTTTSGSVFGARGGGDYASAKGAILALTRGLAGEHSRTNVRINALMPAAHTRMTARIPHELTERWLAKWFPPEKVAAFVAWLCHEDLDVTGETFLAGGGRAAKVLLQSTAGHFEPEPTPESFRDHFAAVMAGDDPREHTDGFDDLRRYGDLLGDPGPFA